jgi:hypothetical protein
MVPAMEPFGKQKRITTDAHGRLGTMSTLTIIGMVIWALVSGVVYAALVAGSRADDLWGYDDLSSRRS